MGLVDVGNLGVGCRTATEFVVDCSADSDPSVVFVPDTVQAVPDTVVNLLDSVRTSVASCAGGF